FVDIHEHQQFGASSLGKLFPTEKRGRGTCASIVERARTQEPIHGISADSRIGFTVSQRRPGPVGWAFEDFRCLQIRTEGAFALADDIFDVRSVRISIPDITQSPRARTSRAWDEYRVVGHEPVVM